MALKKGSQSKHPHEQTAALTGRSPLEHACDKAWAYNRLAKRPSLDFCGNSSHSPRFFAGWRHEPISFMMMSEMDTAIAIGATKKGYPRKPFFFASLLL